MLEKVLRRVHLIQLLAHSLISLMIIKDVSADRDVEISSRLHGLLSIGAVDRDQGEGGQAAASIERPQGSASEPF